MAGSDSVLQLIDTALTFETVTFLRDLVVLAVMSPDYMAFLNRITVQSLTLYRDPQPPRHEGIVTDLLDTDNPESEPIIIFLERTASPSRRDQKYFFSHPGSKTVLQSIVNTLKEMPSTLVSLASSLSTTGTPAHHSDIPLLDFTHIASPPYHPITDEPESAHEPDDEPNDKCDKLPWFDAATLEGVKILHTSTRSLSNPHHAEDRFIGSCNMKTYFRSLQNLRQTKPKLGTLTLFDLAVLADCVHDHAPLYSLLDHNCYWLVQIILAVIEKSYTCTTIRSKKYAPVTEDTICIPANDYLPDLTGRTMGILVSRIEDAVVSLVTSEFEAYKAAKLEEVHLFLY